MNNKLSSHVAIDIGATSGRVILYTPKQPLSVIHRFKHMTVDKPSGLFWDVESIFNEVIIGLKKIHQQGIHPKTVAIDTWAVDYALLDQDNKIIEGVRSYRHPMPQSIIDDVWQAVSRKELYAITGIQHQPFNTIYQLKLDLVMGRLDYAKTFLMLPDYIGYLLTGVKHNEYTNATSTGLVNLNGDWDENIIKRIGLPIDLFKPLYEPREILGQLTPEVVNRIGFNTTVLHTASHDTAAAILPIDLNQLYISSGTWSLVGVVVDKPYICEESMEANFTHEGTPNRNYRFQKNIMGLWILETFIKQEKIQWSYSDIITRAKNSILDLTIDINHHDFFNPISMREVIIKHALENSITERLSIEDIFKLIFNSLAKSYAKTISEIEVITQRKYPTVVVLGGGSQNQFLNDLIVKHTQKPVIKGLTESTAVGNILGQLQDLELINQIKHDFRENNLL